MSMNLEALLNQRKKILQIASKHGASNIQIFGSITRQENTFDSDIDFLVELDA
jgi:predicted nucleotidyltransferase